ncbi:MAG: hypothetical protein QXS62_02035 [Sulfolobales archaeon]
MVEDSEWLRASTSSKGVVNGFTMLSRGSGGAKRALELSCTECFSVRVSEYLAENFISKVLRGWNSV